MPIKIIRGTGFHLTFANGWTVSVQFGYGTYSARGGDAVTRTQSPDAEVGVWDSRGVWDSSYPRCFQTPDQIATTIAEVAARNPQ